MKRRRAISKIFGLMQQGTPVQCQLGLDEHTTVQLLDPATATRRPARFPAADMFPGNSIDPASHKANHVVSMELVGPKEKR